MLKISGRGHGRSCRVIYQDTIRRIDPSAMNLTSTSEAHSFAASEQFQEVQQKVKSLNDAIESLLPKSDLRAVL
jgi:hypothetical protein